MTENVTDNDVFINSYLKKQEDFSVEQIRKRLELEVKLGLLETAYKDKTNELTAAQNMIQQSVTGLQAATEEKDQAKKKVESLEKSNHEVNLLLNEERSKCNKMQYEIDSLREKIKEIDVLRSSYDTLKENYNLVMAELEKCRDGKFVPQPAKINKKKKQTAQDSEWVDGN